MPDGQETRITDPTTGGQKGSKLARFDLIPWDALTELAKHYGRGARKYEDRNWQKGYRWSLSFAALNRHLWAWWGGEDIDEETGSSHMVAVAWHAVALLTFKLRGIGTDDRDVPQPVSVAADEAVTDSRIVEQLRAAHEVTGGSPLCVLCGFPEISTNHLECYWSRCRPYRLPTPKHRL